MLATFLAFAELKSGVRCATIPQTTLAAPRVCQPKPESM